MEILKDKKMKIKEIIVVEGRDDTNRVKEAIDCDTFETNGSALTKKKIERLIFLEKTRGLIVLTDPDYAGKRIRNIIVIIFFNISIQCIADSIFIIIRYIHDFLLFL